MAAAQTSKMGTGTNGTNFFYKLKKFSWQVNSFKAPADL
jgi:hypothetical protein